MTFRITHKGWIYPHVNWFCIMSLSLARVTFSLEMWSAFINILEDFQCFSKADTSQIDTLTFIPISCPCRDFVYSLMVNLQSFLSLQHTVLVKALPRGNFLLTLESRESRVWHCPLSPVLHSQASRKVSLCWCFGTLRAPLFTSSLSIAPLNPPWATFCLHMTGSLSASDILQACPWSPIWFSRTPGE